MNELLQDPTFFPPDQNPYTCDEKNHAHRHFIGKIPILIAEPEVQLDLETTVDLGDDVLEIKQVHKNLFLTQCKLIHIEPQIFGKLFISGFVRQSIEFATLDNHNLHAKILSGFIRHVTVHIPFKCSTSIHYVAKPIVGSKNFCEELQIPCSPEMVGRNFCENSFKHSESFTENIYCELAESKVFEEIQHQDPITLGTEFPYERLSNIVVEKMAIYLKIKLLQNQNISMENFMANAPQASLNQPDKAKCGRVLNPGKPYTKKKR